ncbi:hypothetical protein COCCADRAFT_38629 [Bipolaris zeicola 26-R-13]|uniref:AB hydrolase-1 domain-containing protein n=1 Tax=Cochliobolus carbonum (strain 26-R-13) TaxID=930089 RepID=W6Y7K3_COCC2|nr:uncharacterized protein COCCADRAFT_38629 [Bipolaris zeicola 26-R-13]EUC31269.1 hypothetical protein COCCADRAFT_38629 [Bipolaris zeicola 26-R-13]
MVYMRSWATLSILSFTTASPKTQSALPHQAIEVQSFSQITPSSDLQWIPCYNGFDCANLIVPLDYEDSSVGTTTVAFIRKLAPGNVTQDLLFNPGGPGGSGVGSLLSGIGDLILNLSGEQYNIISFDPRGVNNSGIELTCFPGQPNIRDTYWSTFEELSQASNLDETYARGLAIGQWCTKANGNTTAKYAGTLAAVQDMLHFTTHQSRLRNLENPDESPVNFYGLSYGTIIGQALASKYPTRVGRMVLDGTVNAEDHLNGAKLTAVQDVDAAYSLFFSLCHAAGPGTCAFYAEDVKNRFDTFLSNLEREPVIQLTSTPVPKVITKDAVLAAAFHTLYAGAIGFPFLARGLAALERGDAAVWLEEIARFQRPSGAAQEVYMLVTGADYAGRSQIPNRSVFRERYEEVARTSVYAGRVYALENLVLGVGVGIVPPESQVIEGFKYTETKTPVLFVNPSVDPITPVANARYMAGFFEGAVVLEQNSTGHTVLPFLGECVAEVVKRYFGGGELPDGGKLCRVDVRVDWEAGGVGMD